MRLFFKGSLLILLTSCVACSGVSFSPSHVGHYTFSGLVTDSEGKPIKDATVKVLGWETLSDAQGRWREDILVDCGASRDTMSAFVEKNVILVYANGFEPSEHGYDVERAAWFGSCPNERQEYAFNSVLRKQGTAEAIEEPIQPSSRFKKKPKEQNNGVTL